MSCTISTSCVLSFQVAYRVEADEDGGVILECQHVDEGRLYPEEVAAQLLSSLLQQAEAHLQASISKAVISVSNTLTCALSTHLSKHSSACVTPSACANSPAQVSNTLTCALSAHLPNHSSACVSFPACELLPQPLTVHERLVCVRYIAPPSVCLQ